MDIDTRLSHGGRRFAESLNVVNAPPMRQTTRLFPTMDALRDAEEDGFASMVYGRLGNPTVRELEGLHTELEGGFDTVAVASGLAAISGVLFALLDAGDHALFVDNCFGPTRTFASRELPRLGVLTEFFAPDVGAGLADLLKPETKLVFVESPGTGSFEVADVPAIVAAAKEVGTLVVLDNTWATPLFFDAFGHGVDVTIHSGSKYLGGHSDALIGLIGARTKDAWDRVRRRAQLLGGCPGSEEAWLALRGARTLRLRLRQHEASGLAVARWFQEQPTVHSVLHPALPSCPGHEFWRRDFTGAGSLFGVAFKPDVPWSAVDAFCDALELFGIGHSWGGYESLIAARTLTTCPRVARALPTGPVVRIYIGLEAVDDLLTDVDQAMARMSVTA